MIIGIPKEIKNNEYRAGLIPSNVREVVAHGHQVLVQEGLGAGIGCSDDDYIQAGASVSGSAEEIFARAHMIIKVKEPQAVERAMLREGQVLFTYLHLAPDPDQTHDLVASGATCIAYETVTSPQGGLPLLAPMSQVAGRLSVQAAARSLEKSQGGRGILLGGVPGVSPARVVIIGGGEVGSHAAAIAVGMGADVTVLERNSQVLDRLSRQFAGQVKGIFSTREVLEELAKDADAIIGGVLIPGAAAPKLITKDIIAMMKPGAVIVDVAIDQGGCAETSRPTTHDEPVYMVDGVVHYCVANMPGAVPHTSTYALNNATLPFVLALADQGWQHALRDNPHLRNGLNVHQGKITHTNVAEALGLDYTPPEHAIM